MKTKISIAAIAVLAVLAEGCALNSGNSHIAQNVNPLPYGPNENAVRTVEKKHIDANGKVDIVIETTTESGLEVNKGIQHDKLDVAKKVGTAQVQAKSRPTTYNAGYAWQQPAYYGYGDRSYGDGGGVRISGNYSYGPNCRRW